MKHTLANYSAEMFQVYQGDRFLFEPPAAGEAVDLELLEISSHDRIRKLEQSNPEKYGKRQRDPFSLLFALRSSQPMGPGLHRLKHADFEPCELFLSRVTVPGRDTSVAYYEAVFA
jgi:hypothetical protein